MARAVIVYESKYGNTRLAAQAIAEGMGHVTGVEAFVTEPHSIDFNRMGVFDAVVLGSPNHIGRTTRGIKKFIDRLDKSGLGGERAAIFDTCLARDSGKVVKKMEKMLSVKAPELKLMVPGLSLTVRGMKGPLAENELDRCREFGHRIANLIQQKT
jgi:menaquinone-dependent protoporphyrinogen IX oxidase